ncbi:MAG TPA: penicillin-binding protein [Terriglobales bacterium]|nr:penicillin-binding protein [Terriglobales bacterium]
MASRENSARRLYLLGGFLLLWFVFIAVRLVQLQVVDYGDWLKRAERQQQRTIEVAPRRGVIYDRNGHELAMSVNVDSVFAVPSEVPDPATTAKLLARVLRTDPREVLAHLDSSRTFTWIARKVDAETSQRIRAMNLRGIYFQKESKRFYPKRELAAQVLGWVGLDDEGLGGLEHEYDSQLQGKPGKMLITMDARRRWFGRVERDPEPGESVVLTLDEKIQYIAERELDKAMQDTHAEAGTVIVQNPRTGEILALANRPTFNPNVVRGVKPAALKNRSVSDIYEPGSAFKIVTYSSALEEGVIKPSDMIDCQGGVIDLGGLRIHDLHKLGVVPITEALAKSSDVAAVKVGMRLGEDRFYKYIRDYGFGQQTGIELPGESRGLTKPVSRWSKVSIGAISIGQEIGVTPVQLVSMVSTIANDGVYTPARIVAGTFEPATAPKPVVFHPAAQHRVISTMTAAQMKRLLEGVVLFGTARRAILDGYTSAGKTGTAQKVDPATGRYSKTKYVATFAGFAPVNNPAVTIAVILDSAVGLHQGGQVSAPVFARIAQQVLAYMNVPHDAPLKDPRREQLRASARDSDLEEGTPDRVGDILADADAPAAPASPPSSAATSRGTPSSATTSSAGIVPAVPRTSSPAAVASSTRASGSAGMLPAVARAPAPMAVSNAPKEGGTVVVEVGSGVQVPSLVGMPLRSAVEQAQRAGLEIEAIGSGVAVEQNPAAGTRIAPGGRVAVRFSR